MRFDFVGDLGEGPHVLVVEIDVIVASFSRKPKVPRGVVCGVCEIEAIGIELPKHGGADADAAETRLVPDAVATLCESAVAQSGEPFGLDGGVELGLGRGCVSHL